MFSVRGEKWDKLVDSVMNLPEDISWRMFHVHLRRRCILHLDGMSWRYQWGPSHLMYDLRHVSFLIFCFDELSIGVSGVLKFPSIIVLLSTCPFMSASVCLMYWGAPMFLGGSDGKVSACSVGDLGSIPGLGRSPREGNGNPLQYSCLENSMDWGDW